MPKFDSAFQKKFLTYYESNFESAQEFLEFFAASVTEQYEGYDDPVNGVKLARPILKAAEKVGEIEEELK